MNIRENDFRGIDLNLLITFHVLMRERSVSRAAERMHLGQPAVSGALARLRELFADPLFVRTRTGMEPTSRALRLHTSLAPALQSIHSALFEGVDFDPASTDRTFVVGMPDWVELWLAPLLFSALRRQAPLLRLSIVSTDPFKVPAMLEQGEMDIAVSPVQSIPASAWCSQQSLLRTKFNCVLQATKASTLSDFSLQSYLDRNHLLVSYRSAFESAADDWLMTRGMKRNVIFATTRFAVLPSLLKEAGTITTVPEPIAIRWKNLEGLYIAECPIPLPQIDVSAVWLKTRNNDPGLHWLSKLLASVAAM